MTLVIITLIFVPIIGGLIGFLASSDYNDERIYNSFVGFIVGVLLWMIFSFAYEMKTTTKLSETIYLETIQDNRVQKSTYIFGSGSSISSMVYTFYGKKNSERIKLYEIPYYHVEIEYLKDTTDVPRVEVYSNFIDQSNKTNSL